jgi:copper chaperone NosL
MSTKARVLIALASVGVALSLLLPLWEVRLYAPQYPEGLGLRIRATTVTGMRPADLNSINGLNHYIGMQPITPESIPELVWLPKILAAFAVGAALIAWRGCRRCIIVWVVLLVLLGFGGLWDLHRWEYNYGHHLDLDNAIIIVPGMSYQPPMIGSKQLLNFTALAWPGAGTVALALAGAMATLSLMIDRLEAWRVSRVPGVATA